MEIIDIDLISVQQARILLEEAVDAKDILIEIDKEQREELLRKIKKYYLENLDELTELAHEETSYGNSEDEKKLAQYFINNLNRQMKTYPYINEVCDMGHYNKTVGLSKGLSLVFIAPYLSTISTIEAIYLATRSACPLIIVSDSRCKKAVTKIVEDISKIEEEMFFPKGSLSILDYNSKLGEETLTSSENISLIVENLLSESPRDIHNNNSDVFVGEIGNNIVFIDKSCNINKASFEIINSKAFNNGLIPGVEQAVVVESSVCEEVKNSFKKYGAYFLNKAEEQSIEKVLYDSNYNVRKELIGRSAKEIARIAGVEVDDDIKVLVVTKPYVSMKSPYSKEKYNPILSFYTEDNWLTACEKCVELILNDKKGQSLSIYSKDPYVIEQFIEKKPVERILINTPTGFGSIGIGTKLPITVSLSTKKINGSCETSLNPTHFMKFRQIGVKKEQELMNFLNSNISRINDNSTLFDKVLNSLSNNY